MLVHPTVCDAAEAIGVGEATLRRWLKLEGFSTAYRAARRQAVVIAIAQLQRASGEASDTLHKLLMAESEAVRLRAAVAILDHAQKGLELWDIEERLASLEERMADQANSRTKRWHR